MFRKGARSMSVRINRNIVKEDSMYEIIHSNSEHNISVNEPVYVKSFFGTCLTSKSK